MERTQSTGPWLFVGAGNMAEAIASGGLAAGVIDPDRLCGLDPSPSGRAPFERVFTEPADAAAWLDAQGSRAGLVLATKPQMFPAVCEAWRPVLDAGPSRLVVSILAGTTSAALAAGLGKNARVVRVMPNTPIRIGLGMTALCPGPNAGPDDIERVETLFAAGGKTLRIDEGLMDAFTAVAGSGPAYVFYLADAMLEAAQQLGFDREQALMIVRQTVNGAGELLSRSPETPRALRQAVTSKGGTTAAATGVFDESGVHDAIVRGVHAARHRGADLARG